MTETAERQPLDDAEMYERILASDAAWNGHFYFGVVTTGVYCLPSCRVRKPLRRNVRFFASTAEAEAAGLRACRRCRPDDLVRDEDVERDEVLALLSEVEADPQQFADVESMVARSGYGATRLFEMFHHVLGATPAVMLNHVRIQHARRLLHETNATVLEVALASGFQSASAFHRRFRLAVGMTPLAYRRNRSP